MWSSTVSPVFPFWRFFALIPQVAQLVKQHNKWKSSAVKPRFWRNGRPTYWGHEQQWWQQRANIIPFTESSLGAIFNLLLPLYFKRLDVKVLVCEGCGTISKCKTDICFTWSSFFNELYFSVNKQLAVYPESVQYHSSKIHGSKFFSNNATFVPAYF